MKCADCRTETLKPRLTSKGVKIDRCEGCGGVWLAEGEIFHFTKSSFDLVLAMGRAREKARPSERMSPETEEPLLGFALPEEKIVLHSCPKTGGIWMGGLEVEKLSRNEGSLLSIQFDGKEEEGSAESYEPDEDFEKAVAETGGPLRQLPNLYIRSGATLFFLYALVGLVLIAAVEFLGLSPNVAILIGVGFALLQFLISPFLMDVTLRWFYSMHWVKQNELPGHLHRFVLRACQQSGVKVPRFGIIEDGSPNAFTYGHTPKNARIVITRGILDLLDEGEVEAVVAHEIGHAKHWDMLLMTIAQLVPLVLYYVFRTLIESKTMKSGKKGRSQFQLAVAISAYLLYIVSEYIVLWFSRTREYYADRFAGKVTGRPGDLASALVKIAYGLAGQAKGKEGEGRWRRKSSMEAIGAFGIFDPKVARSLAIASSAGGKGWNPSGGGFDRKTLLSAMRWDLWNPWAKFFELHSTHPLTANRLTYLGEQEAAMGQEPFVLFNLKKPESYWDEFFVDLGIYCMPILAFLVFSAAGFLTGKYTFFGIAMVGAGVGTFMKVYFSYPRKTFPAKDISDLLKEVKVSSVRPVPCSLKGTVIGRGVPGLIWSEDFVLRDNTGIIFLDYRQPSRIWEFFFGLMRGKELRGEEVTVTGWYRRSPVPYVELNTFRVSGTNRTCYVYHVKLAVAALLTVAGLFISLGWFM